MTDRKFTPATVADIREGDTVRLTKGEATVVAPVRHERHYGLYVAIPGLDIAADSIELEALAKADGITLERAEPQLPTAPGFYRPRHTSDHVPALGFHLNENGEWRTLWSRNGVDLRTPNSADLPLVRLIEESAS